MNYEHSDTEPEAFDVDGMRPLTPEQITRAAERLDVEVDVMLIVPPPPPAPR